VAASVMTVAAVLTTLLVWFLAELSPQAALALFLALEGTALLASAFAPPYDEIRAVMPKGLLHKLYWPFAEGRGLRFPISYNPVFFYGGLLLLASSMVLGAF